MEQMQLVAIARRASTIQEQFEDFHRANPWVYDRLVEMTRALVARGRAKVGMKMLFEVVRWEFWMRTADPYSDFKLNNNYHSRYARLIMSNQPDLDGIYETRELKAP